MASPDRLFESKLHLLWFLLILFPCSSLAQNAVPIPLTGWNLDMVFEAGTTSRIDAFWDPGSQTTWGESGNITGRTVVGFPASRTFTSMALRNGTSVPTNTQFQLQPYTGPNVAFLGGSGLVTMNLLTPAKYKTLNVLSASFSDHANFNHVRVTVGFTDRAPVDIIYYYNVLSHPVTFPATSWGEAIWGPSGAIAVERVAHSSALVATLSDPITYSQAGFGLSEAVIDLTQAPYDLQNFTLAWITFNKPVGYSTTTAGIFAVSGTPVAVQQIPPEVTGHPAARVVCEGAAADFTASASGSPTPTVQWQVSTDGGATYSNLAGATAGTLSFPSSVAQSGYRYRAVFTNANGSDTSDPATLIVNARPTPPLITPLPASVVVNSAGNQATGPAGAATYAWTIVGGTITSATNLQTVTYTAGNSADVTLNLTVANASGCTASNSIGVPTYVQPAPPMVTFHPVSEAACVGSSVTIEAAASGSPAPTIQWQVRFGGAGEFIDLPGATSLTLSFAAQLAQNGNEYRATFSSPLGTATTNHATLTVDAPPNTPAIVAEPRSVFANAPGNSASGPLGAASYAWSITNGTLTSASSLPAITYRAGANGLTTLHLTISNTTGCTASNSINVPIVVLPPVGGTTGAPIALTGWNLDMIFEAPPNAATPSVIEAFWDPDSHTTWAESGVITGKVVNGFPSSRIFTSAALRNGTSLPTNTQFQFQPYTGPNVAFLGGSGTATLNLITPARYKSLNVLSASFSTQANNNHIKVTLGFTNRGPIDIVSYYNVLGNPVTFSATNWGIASSDRAISAERAGHSAALVATAGDPITYSQAGFGLAEAVIDLTQAPYDLQDYTLSSITFSKPVGNSSSTAGIFSVSGIANSPPPSPNPQIAEVSVVSGMATIGARRLSLGRGYIVLRSFNLSDWTPIDVFVAETELETWSEPMPLETPVFYRLQEY